MSVYRFVLFYNIAASLQGSSRTLSTARRGVLFEYNIHLHILQPMWLQNVHNFLRIFTALHSRHSTTTANHTKHSRTHTHGVSSTHTAERVVCWCVCLSQQSTLQINVSSVLCRDKKIPPPRNNTIPVGRVRARKSTCVLLQVPLFANYADEGIYIACSQTQDRYYCSFLSLNSAHFTIIPHLTIFKL